MQPGRQQHYSDLMRRAAHIQIHGMRALSLYKNTPVCSPWAQLLVLCSALVWVHPNIQHIFFFYAYLLWSLGRHRVLIPFTQVLRHLVWRFWPQGQCNGGERNFICGSHCIKKKNNNNNRTKEGEFTCGFLGRTIVILDLTKVYGNY